MKQPIAKFVALGIVCFGLVVCALADLTPRGSRKAAPDLTSIDAKGSSIRLAAYKGKVVLLDFWATWCHGCKEEIPWYVEFQNRYERQGFAALGVSMDDDGWKSVRPFLKQTQVNYPIVVGNWDEMSKRFGFASLPVTLLIDREGRIADFHEGMVDKSKFENEIRLLLAENPTKP